MRRITTLVLLALATGLAPSTRGMWKNVTEEVPADRIVENLTAWVTKHPDDAHGHYVLGRVHSMLYAEAVDSLRLVPAADGDARDRRALPGFAPWDSVLVERAEGPLTEVARDHLRAAVRHYARSTKLDAKVAAVHLGLGWMLENGALFAGELDLPPGVEAPTLADEERKMWSRRLLDLGADEYETRERTQRELAAGYPRPLAVLLAARSIEDAEIRRRVSRLLGEAWLRVALAAYRRSFALAVQGDRRQEHFGPAADSAISWEAGKGIERILARRERNGAENAELESVRRDLADFRRKGKAVTPIVFSRDGADRLADLLDPTRRVRFDLDGDGVTEPWPWVRAGTSILVWDPAGRGEVRSGTRLFGSATWWISWSNGYEALAALDDDADGRLTGEELSGIAVWTDRDGDGVSDPGEVRPATSLGIATIATRGFTSRDGVPAHAAGLVLEDGTTLPTWDWTVRGE